MTKRVLVALAAGVLLAALAVLGTPLLQAAPAARLPSEPGRPANLHFAAPTRLQSSPVRRESGPPAPLGPAPRTGPPAPFRPLDPPNWGANVRANTDPQSPNLAQQEP